LTIIRNIILAKSPFVPSADANYAGDINSFDLTVDRNIILVKSPAKVMNLCVYNFSSGAGSNRWAKWNNLTAPPPTFNTTFDTDPAGWVEAASGEYTNISTADGSVWNISGSGGYYTALQCKFTVAEGAYAGNVTSIGVTFNGCSQDSGDLLQFWAWNFTSGAWTQVGSNISLGNSGNPGYFTWTTWGKVYANYIDTSNYMYILYTHNTASKYLRVDYVKLELASP
jgi:hypothetical protein